LFSNIEMSVENAVKVCWMKGFILARHGKLPLRARAHARVCACARLN
jgi:hypothetical protein